MCQRLRAVLPCSTAHVRTWDEQTLATLLAFSNLLPSKNVVAIGYTEGTWLGSVHIATSLRRRAHCQNDPSRRRTSASWVFVSSHSHKRTNSLLTVPAAVPRHERSRATPHQRQ
jgi:hypothetical protein